MRTAAKSAAAEIPALADALAMLADRLTALLAGESALVRAMRVAEIGALQDEKTALTARYQETFNALVAAHGGQPMAPEIKERLARSGQSLGEAVAENELALRVGRAATERLITTIVAAVKEQQQSAGPYAPSRAAAAPRRGFMTAAALDRRL
jgi:hypothetical protein